MRILAVMLTATLLAIVAVPAGAALPDDDDADPIAMPPLPDGPPAPPTLGTPGRSAGTLLLRGDGVTDALDCTGRNVLIEGSDDRYTLRGGCRSVTVQGHGNTVRAELQPGGRIAIAGDDDTVQYTLTGPGAPPAISVTGAASRALASGGGPAR